MIASYHIILIKDTSLGAIRPIHPCPQPDRGSFGGPVRQVIRYHKLDLTRLAVFFPLLSPRLACTKSWYSPYDTMHDIQELSGTSCLSRYKHCERGKTLVSPMSRRVLLNKGEKMHFLSIHSKITPGRLLDYPF